MPARSPGMPARSRGNAAHADTEDVLGEAVALGEEQERRVRRSGAIDQDSPRGEEGRLGACVVTGAGALEAKRVLHAVSAWNEASCIGRAMLRALLSAEENKLRTVAIPALGTGAARVTLEAAATAEAAALRWHLAMGGSQLREIRFVLYGEAKLRAFREVLEDLLVGGAGSPKTEVGLVNEGDAKVSSDGPTFVTPSVASVRAKS